jgi:hypothetical protein
MNASTKGVAAAAEVVYTAVTAADDDATGTLIFLQKKISSIFRTGLWHELDLHVFVAITDYVSFEDFIWLGAVLFSSKGLAKQWDSFRPHLGYCCRTLNDHVYDFRYLNMLLHNDIRIRDVKTVYEYPLHKASEQGNAQIVQYLLDGGLDVNLQNKYESTALMIACQYGFKNVVELMLDVDGIDVNLQNGNQYTALIFASREGHSEIVELLLNVNGIAVNHQNQYLNSALIFAAREGYTPVVKMLLDVDDIDVFQLDSSNNSALKLASKHCHTEVVELLLVKALIQN